MLYEIPLQGDQRGTIVKSHGRLLDWWQGKAGRTFEAMASEDSFGIPTCDRRGRAVPDIVLTMVDVILEAQA